MLEPNQKIVTILTSLIDSFPEIATSLIKQNKHLSDVARTKFSDSPDNPLEHAPKWHQFGIITHSVRCQQYLRAAPMYLKAWGISSVVENALQKEVDGIPKGQLLHIAALLHDVGKFAVKTEASFKTHEDHSGVAIRTLIAPFLTSQGLSRLHIEYIAKCAELHYELGKIRRAAKAHEGYTIAFTHTTAFIEECLRIQKTHAKFALEIGLFFLVDNLSKTEVAITAVNDAEIIAQKASLKKELVARKLDEDLLSVGMQMPVNVSVVKEYLLIWAQKYKKKDLLWLKLTPQSKQKLQDAFSPRYQNQFYDHVTLTDNRDRESVKKLIGTRAQVSVYAYARNDTVEAVRVHTDNLPDTHGAPHITLTTAIGVQPFESVSMLKGSHTEQPIEPELILEGIVEFHPRL